MKTKQIAKEDRGVAESKMGFDVHESCTGFRKQPIYMPAQNWHSHKNAANAHCHLACNGLCCTSGGCMAGSGKVVPAVAASLSRTSDTPGPCLSYRSCSWPLSLQAVLVAQTLGQPWPPAPGQWVRALAGAGAASGLRLGLLAVNAPSSITYG